MQFSLTGTKQGLVQDIDFLCGSNDSSFPLADKTRCVNIHYQDIARLIWDSVKNWEYDDSNNTDLPIATTTLVTTQQDYEIPATCQRLHRLEVLDTAGNYQKLAPLDTYDTDMALTEYAELGSIPTHYDLQGRSIFLYPTPVAGAVTMASGLKVYFDRAVTEFTSASTTAVPGFATAFHRILSVSTSLDFEEDNQKRNLLIQMKDRLEKGLINFYSHRGAELKKRIKPRAKKYWRQYL